MTEESSSFLRNLIILVITSVFSQGLMFLSRILMAKNITEGEYGQISFIWNSCIVIGTLLLLGRGQEALISLPKYDFDQKKQKIQSYLTYEAIFFVFFLLCFIFFLITKNETYLFEIFGSLSLGILYMMFYIPIFIAIGYQRYRSVLYYNSILYILLNIFLSVLIVSKRINNFTIILSFILAFLVGSFAGMTHVIASVNIKIINIIPKIHLIAIQIGNWDETRKFLFFCDFMGISTGFVFFSIMRIYNLPNDELAYVSVALLIGSLLFILPDRIVQALGPNYVNKFAKGDETDYKNTYLLGLKSTVITSSITMLLLGCFIYYFIYIIFSENYALNSIPYILLYIISIHVKSFNVYNSVTLRNSGKLHDYFFINLFEYLSLIFFGLIIIYQEGRVGFYITFLIVQVFTFIITSSLFLKRLEVIGKFQYFKQSLSLIPTTSILLFLYFNLQNYNDFFILSLASFFGLIFFLLLAISLQTIPRKYLLPLEKLFGFNLK